MENEAKSTKESLQSYITKLESFQLFSTQQCYYLVGCNKQNTSYRVLKMDRTLIERQTHDRGAVNFENAHEKKTSRTDSSHAAKPTLRPLSDFLVEDPNVYTQEEIKDMLDMIHDGNRITRSDHRSNEANAGGLKPVVKAFCVCGFIRFLDCYYLTLVTRRQKVGMIGENAVYTVKSTETFPLKPAERHPGSEDFADPSSVLLSMWNRGKRSVGLGLTNREIAELRYQDLTKNFYFSYTYDLSRSLQQNFHAAKTRPHPPPPSADMFSWNHFLTRDFERCLSKETSFYWTMPIIHGAYVQKNVNDYGRSLNVILLARRSRHFAGTRYLKRGVSEAGFVANDVEHEQILHDCTIPFPGNFSSFLQVRGSIPTFWSQESSVTMPKPPIELSRIDPNYTATRLHFADLFARYSSPVLVLDLVKQSEKREREVRVGNEYRHAIDYINATIDDENKIQYCALDYSHISKHRNLDVSLALNSVSAWATSQTGFFCSDPKWKIQEDGSIRPFSDEDRACSLEMSDKLGVPFFPMEQYGVLRTNCIDCLDRTNVAQFSAGVEAIAQQLIVMGIRSQRKLGPFSSIVRVLTDSYVDIGDCIALQYGGSEAHKKVTAGVTETVTGPIGKHKELLTSIRRYYSNAFTDRLKQDAMNLFLGYYLPFKHNVPLWEMENDYYLHNFNARDSYGEATSMQSHRRAFGIPEISISVEDSDHYGTPKSNSSIISNRYQAKADSKDNVSLSLLNRRSRAQSTALSLWWKTALQSNIQQRCWMRPNHFQDKTFTTSRFDRVYHPEKLEQFDRVFSRVWEIPVRRSHADQHADRIEEEDLSDLVRQMTRPVDLATDAADGKQHSEMDVSLKALLDQTDPQRQSTFTPFIRHFEVSGRQSRSPEFIGASEPTKASEEYIRYCSSQSSEISPHSYPLEKVAEFKKILHENSLHFDDVAGIREMSKSANIGHTIFTGEYWGLSKEHSAIEAATTIHEQFNALENFPVTGKLLVEKELERRGYGATGVREIVTSGWKKRSTADRLQYQAIVEAQVESCKRSDMTGEDSMRLYASQFNPETALSVSDQVYMHGSAMCDDASGSTRKSETMPPRRSSAFVKKAERVGIAIRAYPVSSMPPQEDGLPSGFEQINDNMFSRKANKFMVFNRAGMASWKDFPVTRPCPVEKIVLSTAL